MTAAIVLLLFVCISLSKARPDAVPILPGLEQSFVGMVDPVTFDDVVMKPVTKTVVVVFCTSWAPSCQSATPALAEAAEMLKATQSNGDIVVLDSDEHREFARRFRVEAYPTLLCFVKARKHVPPVALFAKGDAFDAEGILRRIRELEAAAAGDHGEAATSIGQEEGEARARTRRGPAPPTLPRQLQDPRVLADGFPQPPQLPRFTVPAPPVGRWNENREAGRPGVPEHDHDHMQRHHEHMERHHREMRERHDEARRLHEEHIHEMMKRHHEAMDAVRHSLGDHRPFDERVGSRRTFGDIPPPIVDNGAVHAARMVEESADDAS